MVNAFLMTANAPLSSTLCEYPRFWWPGGLTILIDAHEEGMCQMWAVDGGCDSGTGKTGERSSKTTMTSLMWLVSIVGLDSRSQPGSN